MLKNCVQWSRALTTNWVQLWNSVLDVLVRRVVVLSEDFRLTLMTRVSLGWRRLAQNLVSAPAWRTAGTATMYCLQPQEERAQGSLDERWKTLQPPPTNPKELFRYFNLYLTRWRWTYGPATARPAHIQLRKSVHVHICVPGRPMVDWGDNGDDESAPFK